MGQGSCRAFRKEVKYLSPSPWAAVLWLHFPATDVKYDVALGNYPNVGLAPSFAWRALPCGGGEEGEEGGEGGEGGEGRAVASGKGPPVADGGNGGEPRQRTWGQTQICGLLMSIDAQSRRLLEGGFAKGGFAARMIGLSFPYWVKSCGQPINPMQCAS